MENFCNTYNVSRETYEKLNLYCQSLIEWQQKFNLVGNGTLPEVWNRHFVDSAQLFRLIPAQAKSLLDMGSGAGFPGMVLAIMANAITPYLNVTLAESTAKKTLYLKHVSELTSVNVEILNTRVENIQNRHFEVITARAMTALDSLLAYAYPLLAKDGICIFPKGRNVEDELLTARRHWNFDCCKNASQTSEDGQILIISGLTKKGKK